MEGEAMGLQDMLGKAADALGSTVGRRRKPEGNRKSNDRETLDRVRALEKTLKEYMSGKSALDARIIENDRWYRSQHWQVEAEKSGKRFDASTPEPVSAFLWNTIANRHGDLMDAFPEPVFVEREASDAQEARNLSKIVKVILELNRFRKTYSHNAWYKVKAGVACYGVFWDQSLEGGLGDISVKPVDILRLFWEPGVSNAEDSQYIYSAALVDTDQLRKRYPALADSLRADAPTMGVQTQGMPISQLTPADIEYIRRMRMMQAQGSM
jgi:hypothetical protein